MRKIAAASYKPMPWVNGRGVTQEILLVEEDGRLLWRLSRAEVPETGPFSLFPGLARILTVIEGAGLSLEGSGLSLQAQPWAPVAFPGDVPVTARLLGGRVADLNLIYDPARLSARARLVTGPSGVRGAGLATVLFLAGAPAGRLAPGDTGLLDPGEEWMLPEGAKAVVLDIARRG